MPVEALLERGQLGIEEFEGPFAPGTHQSALSARPAAGALVERGIANPKGAAQAVRYHLRGQAS